MKLTKTCARFLRKHGGTILAVVASIGVVATAIETGLATTKAQHLLEVDEALRKYNEDEQGIVEEPCTLPTYEERLEYLKLHGEVGRDTFGFDRWLNQDFYQSREWRQFRDRIIARDNGCDLGCKDHPITDWVLRDGRPVRPRISIHHLNPITKEDVIRHSDKLLDPENAICVSAATHKAIHYGTVKKPQLLDGERKPGDTCPWRK